MDFFFVLFTFDRYRQLDKKKRSQFVNDFSIEEKQIQIRFYLSMEYLLLRFFFFAHRSIHIFIRILFRNLNLFYFINQSIYHLTLKDK